MRYIVHNTDGIILRTGYCSASDLLAQAKNEETAIEDTYGDTDDTRHRIVNGQRADAIPIDQVPELSRLRARRNALLLASDWTQLPDVPLATKQAWATNRQALRDITSQPDQLNIVWPTPP